MSDRNDQKEGLLKVNNENLTVVATKKPNCVVHLDIKVNPLATEAAFRRAIKSVQKEVNIPGFRKGKAPESMIVDRYASAIEREFVDVVLQTAFKEALELTQLHPLNEHSIRRPIVHACKRGEGAHIEIEFESRVNVPAVDLQTLQLTKSKKDQVSEKEREKAKENFALQHAQFHPIEGRCVQANDFIEVDITLLTEPPRRIIEKQKTKVNTDHLPQWLLDKIIGMQVGETLEGTHTPTANEQQEGAASVGYRIHIYNLLSAEIPEIDEKLAEKLGAPSAQAILDSVERSLLFNARESALRENIESLERYLVDQYPFDLPHSLVEMNVEHRLNEHFKRIGQKPSSAELKGIKPLIEKEVASHLRVLFLLRKVIADHKLSVSDRDVAEELQRQVQLSYQGESSINWQSQGEAEKALREMALGRKVREFLIEKAMS